MSDPWYADKIPLGPGLIHRHGKIEADFKHPSNTGVVGPVGATGPTGPTGPPGVNASEFNIDGGTPTSVYTPNLYLDGGVV